MTGEQLTGKRIGYRRVSTVEQNTARQLADVKVDKLFEDKASGKDRERPALKAALEYCREGDVLIVHSMDRLARNLGDLLALVKDLTGRGVAVQFLKPTPQLFTGSKNDPMANLLLQLLGAVAEFERALILERQREGIAIAKSLGKYKGRARSLSLTQAQELRQRALAGESKSDLATAFDVSRETVYAYLRS
jgi:DNA invertase Pin-like site-specific DNA recombinase